MYILAMTPMLTASPSPTFPAAIRRRIVGTLPAKIQEAIEVYCEAEDMDIPAPTPLEVLTAQPEYQDGVWLLVDVDERKVGIKEKLGSGLAMTHFNRCDMKGDIAMQDLTPFVPKRLETGQGIDSKTTREALMAFATNPEGSYALAAREAVNNKQERQLRRQRVATLLKD